MILAASGQQAVGVFVAVALVVGWGVYLLVHAFRPDRPPGDEIDTAPNRKPYFDDEALEGPKLTSALSWGLISLAFVAVALPVYWLREPSRQKNAEKGFLHRSEERGAELFSSASSQLPPGHIAAGCADCHGNAGQGGGVKFILQNYDPKNPKAVKPVTWKAPALNTVYLRFSRDEVKNIIVFGRPPTPMPAWGVEGGGALGDQQVEDVLNFLDTIQISSKKAKAETAQVASGKGSGDGAKLFDAFCSRCHTLGWSYRDDYQEPNAPPGGGALGPNLRSGDTVRQFPALADHVQFVTEGSEFGKNYGRRGIGGIESGGMPGFGGMLSKDQIEAIVKYERGL